MNTNKSCEKSVAVKTHKLGMLKRAQNNAVGGPVHSKISKNNCVTDKTSMTTTKTTNNFDRLAAE